MKTSMAYWWSYAEKGMSIYWGGRGRVRVPLRPGQISRGLARDRTTVSATETLSNMSLLLCPVLPDTREHSFV
jgi:hypothetical protein